MKKLHAIVRGRVQGVGFRYFVQREANALGLVGWVKNLPDDSVEVEAFGSPEKLDRLCQALNTGPALARVDNVNAEFLAAGDAHKTQHAFQIR